MAKKLALSVALVLASSTAFVAPRTRAARSPSSFLLARASDGDRVVRLGGGTEMMVAKRRRRHSEEEEAEAEAEVQETTRVVEQQTSVGNSLESKLRFAEDNALPIAVGVFILYKKLTTGTWLEWGMQRFDNSVSRRSSVQSEDDLKKLNVMCCESCGYTIFPALGRTFRFDRFTNKCSSCGAVGSFFDKNDPDDERNLNPDGTSKIDERRTYMKEWINADKDKVQQLRKEYKIKTDLLAKKGALPPGLAKEIADKKRENKEMGIKDEDNEEPASKPQRKKIIDDDDLI